MIDIRLTPEQANAVLLALEIYLQGDLISDEEKPHIIQSMFQIDIASEPQLPPMPAVGYDNVVVLYPGR